MQSISNDTFGPLVAYLVPGATALIGLSPFLPADDITEFQALFKRETGREISPEQAAEYAERVIRVVVFAAGIEPFPPLK
jgi:hypothetical protein